MKEVKVDKKELLGVLTRNREKHQQVFEEALQGYKAKVIATLEKLIEDARAGKRLSETFYIPRPTNQTHEYNRAIKMLEMSVEDEIILTTQEFEQYVMDRWRWKQDFLNKSANYSITASTQLAEETEGEGG